ncbi:MAG: acyltransferase [Bacillaceae bacterium]|nr:acyltransferase [Bacillaceae bacterium]
MHHNRIDFLDYLRGIMALCVLIYHYSAWSGFHYMYPFDQLLSRLGIYAVSTFYIISGASLAYVYSNYLVSSAFIKAFSIKRAFRIVPLFYLATTLTILLRMYISNRNSNFTGVPSLDVILKNFSLLFSWIWPKDYIATGAWSIGNELVFYSLFPLMLFLYNKSLKHYLLFFTITILISGFISEVLLNKNLSLTEQWGEYINPLNQLYLFAGGFLIGVYAKRDININRKMLMSLLVVSVIIFVFLPEGDNRIAYVIGHRWIIFSVAIFSMCIFAVFWGNVKYNPFTFILKYLGDISYSIYLLHPIVYLSIYEFNLIIPIYESKITHALWAVILSFVFSTLVYYFFEKPLIEIGKKFLKNYRSRENKTNKITI